MTIKQELVVVNCTHFQCELGVTRVDPVAKNMPDHTGPGTPKFLVTALERKEKGKK